MGVESAGTRWWKHNHGASMTSRVGSPEPQYIWPAERSCSRSILTCNFKIRTEGAAETPLCFYPFHLRF
eukprot:COSAG01_NODE_1724_length_9382_cov_6.435743_2_plen_69_part_00